MAERSEVQGKTDNGWEWFLAFGLGTAGVVLASSPLLVMQVSGIWVNPGSFVLSAMLGMIGGGLAAAVIAIYVQTHLQKRLEKP